MGNTLPNNWVVVSLADVTKNVKGKKPKVQSEVEFDGSVPYMDIKALEHNEIRQFADIESSKLFEEGDVAMVWDGARSGWVSKTNFGAIGSTIVALKAIKFSSDYLYYYLLDKYAFINSNARGVGIPHVDPTVLWNLEFPLPPLAEQNRIVEKLDSLFAQLETIKTSMAKVPDLLKNFRQQVLTQAVTGKLTEEWRRGKEFEEWRKIKMDEIVETIQAGKNFICLETPVTSGQVGLVKISAVTWGVFNPKETKTVTDIERINPNYFIKQGDFLISRANTLELVGSSVIVDEIEHKIMISDKVWRVIFRDDEDKTFINYFLKTKIGRSEIESRATGNQLSMRNLSQNNFKDINIKLPSKGEQQEIVSRVESLFTKADAIEKQYETLKAKIDTLPQAILHKAFKGELTQQLDSDGDARELLEQIQELKNNTLKSKKK